MTPPQAKNALATETAQRLGVGRPKRRLMHLIVSLVVIIGLVSGVVVWRMRAQAAGEQRYETEKVVKGRLRISFTATGTIESVGSVEVGAEISGRVDEVLVRFNDTVTKGQVMAKINTEQLGAKLKEGTAQSLVSAANVSSARASVEEAEAKAARSRTLSEKGLLSTQELDSVLATEKKAKAALATAQAQQAVSAASLEAARANLNKATIRSPVDGVVLNRSVEPGQTVASSLQAPVLFLVAQDLTTMKLKVNIDEADVGNVHEGQEATFRVDAYPKKQFPSVVKFVKNVPTSGKDVVTYEAELSVSNTERLLRPGMTATATIVTEEKTGALLVPNAALRFTPPNAQPTSSGQRSSGLSLPGLGKPPGMGRSSGSSRGGEKKAEGARVWVLQNGQPTPIRLAIGLTDGTSTEVTGGDLSEGAEILVDIIVGTK